MRGGGAELIIDGTNIAWSWTKTRPQMLRADHGAAQRLLVAGILHSPLRGSHQELTFVFDGPPPATGPSAVPGVRVLYPDPGQSADERILELVERARLGRRQARVATSDRALRQLCREGGATTLTGPQLLELIDPQGTARPRALLPPGRSEKKPQPNREDTAEWLRRFEGDSHGQKTGDSR